MPKFVTKPIEIEAVWFNGSNLDEIRSEFGDTEGIVANYYPDESYNLTLTTADGHKIPCDPYMWVMKDSKPDTFYPCNDDHFQKKYLAIQ